MTMTLVRDQLRDFMGRTENLKRETGMEVTIVPKHPQTLNCSVSNYDDWVLNIGNHYWVKDMTGIYDALEMIEATAHSIRKEN